MARQKGYEVPGHKWFARIADAAKGTYKYFYSAAELAAYKTRQQTRPQYDPNGHRKNNLNSAIEGAGRSIRKAGRSVRRAIESQTKAQYDPKGFRKNNINSAIEGAGRSVKRAGRSVRRAIESQTKAQYDPNGHRKNNLNSAVEDAGRSVKRAGRSVRRAIESQTKAQYDPNGHRKNNLNSAIEGAGRSVKRAGRSVKKAIESQTKAQYDSNGHRKNNLNSAIEGAGRSVSRARRSVRKAFGPKYDDRGYRKKSKLSVKVGSVKRKLNDLALSKLDKNGDGKLTPGYRQYKNATRSHNYDVSVGKLRNKVNRLGEKNIEKFNRTIQDNQRRKYLRDQDKKNGNMWTATFGRMSEKQLKDVVVNSAYPGSARQAAADELRKRHRTVV